MRSGRVILNFRMNIVILFLMKFKVFQIRICSQANVTREKALLFKLNLLVAILVLEHLILPSKCSKTNTTYERF
eukprot:07497.XXX_27942_28163_1 [CDS] Oithona nana genome sequencing.